MDLDSNVKNSSNFVLIKTTMTLYVIQMSYNLIERIGYG